MSRSVLFGAVDGGAIGLGTSVLQWRDSVRFSFHSAELRAVYYFA